MKNSVRIIAAAAALAACGLASAQSAGSWMARVGVTHLAPDVDSGNLSAPSFANTKVDAKSNTQLGGGITYMVTDNLALDVPLATPFKHDLVGDGAIAGVGKLGSTKAIPATLLMQYRFNEANAAFRPYVGVGVTYAHFYGEKTTATLNGLTGGTLANPTTAKVDDKFGALAQLGFVYNFNERWFVDASYSKSFLKTKIHLSSGQSINVKLNPNVFALAVGYRF
ncbi:MAG: outer membrane beta-barrel protein [Comamonas sp.]|jgi:outer membrane protein|uniref:OmpW/AlkL family protein n=1 Tax=Comamonas sp. TaxID=34028 RepID=UPI0028276198|nr:OmpW family outer membrane protein [Comamonas sp.]MDR0216671.1 outer membrane beta-barrel protein [Comamonas sp.]MDR2300278.1 outer membrane beta-barrel protein [Comamonas sp.]